ncbi:alpha/beta hydrolase [Maricaulis sp.]|uniref:alpha/beta fold hydrolase n=1 Tax=Maricaulis sp. TaxID=1486257 RepID=UPI00260FAB1E|nr:alpha/beta hydrolase [Maricaulis sp.]
MKTMRSALAGLAAMTLTPFALAQEEAMMFEAQSGQSVEAFRGRFEVPENRADPDSRMIEIGYVRFPATTDNPGAPIVYLAGGPGGSGTGTARGRRFDLFMQMRQHGDVIAFDQRGTGLSGNDLPRCVSSQGGDDLARLTYAEFSAQHIAAIEECGAFWREQGIDLAGYTTRESVQDISDLREQLGADQVSLWGISYGTHLALAAIKDIPAEIDRAILASVEGLDQTVKLPAQTNAYFDRLQAAVDAQPAAAAAYPDIAALIRRVHERLEDEPMRVSVPQRDGPPAEVLVHRHQAEQFVGGLIADPGNAAILLALYTALDAGDTTLLGMLLQRFVRPGTPISLRPMPTAMDVVSGISAERLAMFEQQAPDGLTGGMLNFPMPQASGVWDGFDLGDEFRTNPTGDMPVLVLSGTLDGRTYPQSQAEAVSDLSDVHIVTVENAGHNLFMTSPDVHDVMHAFMRGERGLAETITVELQDMTLLPF